jgi:hypothetical protein
MPNGWRLAEDRVNGAKKRTQKHAPRKHILKGKNPIDIYLVKARQSPSLSTCTKLPLEYT